MKKNLFLLFLLLNNLSYGKSNIKFSDEVSIVSMESIIVSNGLDINIETFTTSVPTYLGYTYNINDNIVNISLCYYLSPLAMSMNNYHTLHIPISQMSSYIINLSVYSSTSSSTCDYSLLEDSTFRFLDSKEFISLNKDVKVFPNPSNGDIEFKSEYYTVNNIKMYDITGRLVKESSTLINNIRDLHDGTYFILITTEKGSITRKIILKK